MSDKCYVVYKAPKHSFEIIILSIWANEESAQKELQRYDDYAFKNELDCYTYHMAQYNLNK